MIFPQFARGRHSSCLDGWIGCESQFSFLPSHWVLRWLTHKATSFFSTGWQDAWGCSFKAELVALHCAVVCTTGALTVCMDCKSLRNIFEEVRWSGFVPE